MIFLKKNKRLVKEIDILKKAEARASKKFNDANQRFEDVVVKQNGFHLVLKEAVTGKGKHKHAN